MATSSSETGAATENNSLTLLTSDDEKFVVPKFAALQSLLIKNMVNDGYPDDIIPLPNINARILSKITPYLMKHANERLSKSDLQKFDEEFLADESLDDLRDCMTAANYLELTSLIGVVALKITNFTERKSVAGEDYDDELLKVSKKKRIE